MRIKFLEDYKDAGTLFKKGKVVNVSKKSGESLVKKGIAKVVEETKESKTSVDRNKILREVKRRPCREEEELKKRLKEDRKIREQVLTKDTTEDNKKHEVAKEEQADGDEIEETKKIMEENQCDRETAWKRQRQRKEQEVVKKRQEKPQKKTITEQEYKEEALKHSLKEDKRIKEKILKKKETRNILPKLILDKYRPLFVRKDRVYLKNDVAQVDTSNPEHYEPEKYDINIVLQTAPKDAIVTEFEEDDKKICQRYISEMEESCRATGMQCCVTGHGGKSDYLRIYNIKGMPVGSDARLAKLLLLDTLLPSGAKKQLDRSNLGWTYSPVIGHQHWKPKYHGALHKFLRGVSPVDQVNEYPKELLKKIAKAKKITKADTTELLRNNQWVNDFLINYCTTHRLPKGARHHVVEKNMAALLFHRDDRDAIIDRYLPMQGRETNTLNTWLLAIATGRYTQVSVLEIKKYIRDNEIPYTIPKETGGQTIEEPINLTKNHIDLLKDPKLLFNIVELIQSQGVVGEETPILTIINKASLRLVKRHKATSSNVVVSDLSGSGKDVIVNAVTKVTIPSEKIIHRTRFSDKALEYFMTNKPDDFTLDGHVIYLEDPEDDLLKSQAFRVMSSGENKATVVKDQELLELEVRGKPVIIVTSMGVSIDEEGGRRWDAIQTDTSEILTKLVIKEKLRQNIQGINWKKMPELAQALHGLKPYEVIIPFANKLFPYFEENPSLIMRTQVDKFLDYVKASAIIHQHQREKDSKGRLIADEYGFDYEYAKYVFNALGDAEGGMLNTIERKLVEVLGNAGRPLSFSEICQTKGFPRTKDWLYKHFDNLKSRRIVREISEWDDKANKQVTKLYTDIGCSSIPLPHGSVLFGFIDKNKNQQQRGFIGFISFINIMKELNEKRKKCGLMPLQFDDLDETILQVPLSNSDEKKVLVALNHNKTNKTNKTNLSGVLLSPDKTNIKPLHDKIADVKNYVEKVMSSGHDGVSYDALVDHFEESLISKLIESGQLVKIPGTDIYKWEGK